MKLFKITFYSHLFEKHVQNTLTSTFQLLKNETQK